jgi:hypothetical protein
MAGKRTESGRSTTAGESSNGGSSPSGSSTGRSSGGPPPGGSFPGAGSPGGTGDAGPSGLCVPPVLGVAPGTAAPPPAVGVALDGLSGSAPAPLVPAEAPPGLLNPPLFDCASFSPPQAQLQAAANNTHRYRAPTSCIRTILTMPSFWLDCRPLRARRAQPSNAAALHRMLQTEQSHDTRFVSVSNDSCQKIPLGSHDPTPWSLETTTM